MKLMMLSLTNSIWVVDMVITIARKPKKHPLFLSPVEMEAFSDEEMTVYIERVFTYYRELGYPHYPTDRFWRMERFLQLQQADYENLLEPNNSIRQAMTGLGLAWSYFPHSIYVKCGVMKTVNEAFQDDKLLRGAIRKTCVIFKRNMSDASIRRVMKMYTGVQGVSNFRPTSAACIYHYFGKGKIVWDMSCGYGGRLLGAELAGVGKYIGTEPCELTYRGLLEMIDDFITIPTEIHKCGSEEFLPEPNSLDLCFTSPPYFNTEKYSDEKTQSWKKYPTKRSWTERFLKKTMENCWLGLKEGGKMLINIANVKSFPYLEKQTVKTAKQVGFKHIDTWNLTLSSLMEDGHKLEPIFIFQKMGTIK